MIKRRRVKFCGPTAWTGLLEGTVFSAIGVSGLTAAAARAPEARRAISSSLESVRVARAP